MGYAVGELRRLRSTIVGTEVGMDVRDDREIQTLLADLELQPKLQGRQEAILARYINDMRCAAEEASRVLVRDGRAVYVVGENTIRGTFVRNAMIVDAVASAAGLRCTSRRSRELPPNRRYLPPPSKEREVALLAIVSGARWYLRSRRRCNLLTRGWCSGCSGSGQRDASRGSAVERLVAVEGLGGARALR